MPTVRLLSQTAHGVPLTCLVVGELVRETPKSYFFQHPFYTAGEAKRVSQTSGYHVAPCRYCPTWKRA